MEHERIYYLNGLRGILAIIVFIHHFLYAFYPELIFGGSYEAFLSGQWTLSRLMAYTPLNLVFNPGMAINFFFLLSGYVQAHHYLKTQDTVFLQRSFIKRYFRLALPVLAVVVLVFVFHRLHLIRNGSIPSSPLSHDWSKSMLPDNLGFLAMVRYGLIGCFGTETGYYQVLWTMTVELYNSWMVLILLMVTHRIKNKVPLLLAWLLVQAVFLQAFYSMCFTMGLLLCQLHLHSPAFNRLASGRLAKAICLIAGLYFASYPFTGYEHSTQSSLYRPISFFDVYPHVISFAIGDLLLFIVILHSSRAKAALARPLLLFFGKISFMFYLLHFLILFSFSAWLYQLLVPYLVEAANLWVTGLLSFGLITGASFLLYKWVDKPVLRLCNSGSRKIFGL